MSGQGGHDDGATVFRPQSAPPPFQPHTPGPDEGTRIVPRTGTTETGSESTRIVSRHQDGPPSPAQSWVSDESWQRQTGTPSSIPPINASQVPTFPQFQAGQVNDWAAYSMPEDRFVAPPEQRTRQRQPLPVKKVLGWGLAVVLLAVVAGVGYVTFFRKPAVDPNVHVPVSTTAQVQVLRGDEVVRQYLQALAAGDVAKARSLGPLGGSGSTALISRQAFAASLKAAPITDIVVPTTDENATDIPATYKIGGKEYTARFRVKKVESGTWTMERTTVTFRMRGTSVDNVPLIVNGVRIDWETPLELFPGYYPVSTGLPFVAYNSSDALTVVNLGYTDITDHPVTPVLTEPGLTAFKQAVNASLDMCVSRKELSPANCPMGFQSSRPVVPSSVVWQKANDPVSTAKPGLVATDQSKVEALLTPHFTLSLTFTDQGRLNNSPIESRAIATAVMTVGDASAIKVEWRNV
ncbi:hypothetical protein ACQB6R_11625 [Propionibacteriaceae bacterium G1746]|uniref:hypothetical protein n=1 Tax=Aestuariimicrobium sp. G57 TaxID=3418485 RepID=UPI003C17787B